MNPRFEAPTIADRADESNPTIELMHLPILSANDYRNRLLTHSTAAIDYTHSGTNHRAGHMNVHAPE
jgi:hypothetical protein